MPKKFLTMNNLFSLRYSLRYSLFGIAGGQEVDHTFVKFIIYPLTMFALSIT